MQTLGNLIFGAALACLSLGPSAWTEASSLGAPLPQATATVAGTGRIGASLDHSVAVVRAAFPLPPAHLRNR